MNHSIKCLLVATLSAASILAVTPSAFADDSTSKSPLYHSNLPVIEVGNGNVLEDEVIASTTSVASLFSGLDVINAQGQDVTTNAIGIQEVTRTTIRVPVNSTVTMGGPNSGYTYDLYDTTGGPWSITSDGKLTNGGVGSAYLDLYMNGTIALKYKVVTYFPTN
ncbi:hypothetical protein RQP50_05675 [Paenibacillus sp. chi10]|uniref:Uncharacterized protein n=1 Tax=Paenibacillus suaedae TaxID=3077233 RepID=A0AAJ2JWU3_9BACL|nr:hypothetical protein [Paenibacillus sp. chi10]MDT8975728.1 hypothetical protein [Paenibacillus sp. chi10]